MKKGMLTLGLILMVLGLGLSWTGRRLGGETRATVRLFGHSWEVAAPGATLRGGWHISSADIHEPVSTAVPGSADETAAFTAVGLDVALGSVTVAAGDSYLVDVSYWGKGYKVLWTNDNGALKIWSESDGVVTGANCGSDITVYVPAGAALKDLNVQLDLGNVTLAGLTVDTATLDLDLGDVIGEELTVCSSLYVDADLGAVTLYGDLSGSVEIDADLGDVTLGLRKPADNYTWDLTAHLGSVTVDGRSHSGNSSSDTGGSTLKVDADLGNIRVDFRYAPERPVTVVDAGTAEEPEYVWSGVPVPTPSAAPEAPQPPTPPAAPSAPAWPGADG